MFPGEATEEDGHFAALLGAEWPLDGTREVAHRAAVETHHAGQSGTLLCQLALNFFFALRAGQFIYREINASNGHGFPLPRVDLILNFLSVIYGHSIGTAQADEECDECRDGRYG